MRGPARLLRRTHQWLNRRGIDAPAAFQRFLLGGIASLCCLLSLYFLESGPSSDWHQEALALIISLTLVIGLTLMGAGYLAILLLRLSRFLDTDDDQVAGAQQKGNRPAGPIQDRGPARH